MVTSAINEIRNSVTLLPDRLIYEFSKQSFILFLTGNASMSSTLTYINSYTVLPGPYLFIEILGLPYVHNLPHFYQYFVYNYSNSIHVYVHVCVYVHAHLALKVQVIYKCLLQRTSGHCAALTSSFPVTTFL